MKETHLARSELIEKRIFLIRGQRVMIDRDLADLYGVETKYLNRQVKRNRERFPPEFMFQLTSRERNELVTNWHRFVSLKHSTVLPYAFTEHGVAMLSSVLHGKRAIHINILIIKVFVKLREILATHKELAQRLQELEVKIEKHDEAISAIFEAIRQLMAPPLEKPKRPIGF
jgi:phage regulator Rha-like protein